MSHALLRKACRTGDIETARQLLEKNADMNAVAEGGRTAVHWAAAGGYVDLLQLLCNFNANLFIKDEMDRTPIDVAREKGFTTLATLLEARAVGSKVKEQECLRQLQHEEEMRKQEILRQEQMKKDEEQRRILEEQRRQAELQRLKEIADKEAAERKDHTMELAPFGEKLNAELPALVSSNKTGLLLQPPVPPTLVEGVAQLENTRAKLAKIPPLTQLNQLLKDVHSYSVLHFTSPQQEANTPWALPAGASVPSSCKDISPLCRLVRLNDENNKYLEIKDQVAADIDGGSDAATVAPKVAERDKLWRDALTMIRTKDAVNNASQKARGVMQACSNETNMPLEAFLREHHGVDLYEAFSKPVPKQSGLQERVVTASIDAWVNDYQKQIVDPWQELMEVAQRADALVKQINSALPDLQARGDKLTQEAVSVATQRSTRLRHDMHPNNFAAVGQEETKALAKCEQLATELSTVESALKVVEEKHNALVKAVTNVKAARKQLRLLQAQEDDEKLSKSDVELIKKKIVDQSILLEQLVKLKELSELELDEAAAEHFPERMSQFVDK